jgi:hypothetical protein
MRLVRSLDSAEQRCEALEAESAGLRKTLGDCQSRHQEQLSREREEAGETMRHVRAQQQQQMVVQGGGGGGARVEALLEDFLAQVCVRNAACEERGRRAELGFSGWQCVVRPPKPESFLPFLFSSFPLFRCPHGALAMSSPHGRSP